jgi:hypothetical protein
MLEVAEPAFQDSIQLRTDSIDVPAVVTAGLAPDGVFELVQAFLARPFLSSFKMVAQEVEPASLASIYYPSFSRMEL